MKKLMIIGAGIGQVPILKKAQQKGIHVTVASPPGKYPALKLADEVCNLDIYDRENIIKYAKEHNIDAVISDQNDLTMPTVAYVAEKLGLPGNRFEQAIAYSNKNIFRNNCKKLNIPSPVHTALENGNIPADFEKIPLPWIVKPEDSQSSIGVTKIKTREEAASAIQNALSHSPSKRAILEEFFTGHEVVCEGFICNGKYYLLSFADRRYFNLPNMLIPTQTLFPSTVKPEWLEKIVGYEKKMAEYIAPNFGIVHSEYLINLNNGEIRAVESALRGGGVYISSHLIPLSTGIDINEILLDFAMGNNPDADKLLSVAHRNAAAYVCFYLPEGEVISVEGLDELKTLPFVKETFLSDIKIGLKSEKMLYKGMRKGPILINAANRKELDKNIETVQNMLKITVRQKDGNIGGICWE